MRTTLLGIALLLAGVASQVAHASTARQASARPAWSHAEIERMKADARFPVYLRDGSVVLSRWQPRIALGSLLITEETGRSRWIELESVDLEPSRAAWIEPLRWTGLDSHVGQGCPFPEIPLVDSQGATGTLPEGSRPQLIILWAYY